MASVNTCIFVGNVTRDIEMRYSSSGEAIANFSIAVNETWKDKSGQKKERVEYVNMVAYRKLAEIIGEYVKKGSSIYVEGKMQTRKWQDKSGNDRYSTEIIANQMQMLGSRATHTADDYDDTEQDKSNPKHEGNIEDIESDIPF